MTDTTKRARLVVGAATAGAVAVATLVAKRVLGHGDAGKGAPEAEVSPIPMSVTEKPVAVPKPDRPGPAKPKPPKPKPKADNPAPVKPAPAKEPKAAVKPKPVKADAGKPKADKPKQAKPKAAKAKSKAAPKPKATGPTGTDAPQKPAVEPGDRSHDKEPHHALNNPVGDPDETEYPDPFEKRDDPRDPVDPDGAPFGEEPHPQTGSESTSEPPPSQDPEVGDRAKPPKRDKLDD